MQKLKIQAQASLGMQSGLGMRPLPTLPKELAVPDIYDILLEWGDNSDNETGFVIEHSLDDTEWSELVTLSPDTTSYLVTIETDGVDSSVLNYFRVKAISDFGDSNYSNEAEI